MTYVGLNENDQEIYSIDIDLEAYDRIIINNGDGAQTVDIDLAAITGGIDGIWIADTMDGSGHYEVGGYYTYVPYVPASSSSSAPSSTSSEPVSSSSSSSASSSASSSSEPSSIKTVYVTNNLNWAAMKAYMWGESTSENAAWPGVDMTYVGLNEYSQKIYSIEIDFSAYDHIVINNGAGAQTVDVDLAALTDGLDSFWINSTTDGSGHYNIGGYYTYEA